jgi:Domain of unknown function (DUF4965)/Domain of unknown function (DUF1793)/Domain of unknown function (DUF5127)/Domain of unknown function (DUF4964)
MPVTIPGKSAEIAAIPQVSPLNRNGEVSCSMPQASFLNGKMNASTMRSARSHLCKWALALSVLLILEPVSSGQVRPPAVPLVAHNPYFSIWSMANQLTDGNTRHWTGAEQPLTGMIRVDGSVYRYMGESPSPDVPAMRQLSVKVEATGTVYVFEAAGVQVELTFFTPAFPEDLDILSRPVTYLTWHIRAIDGKKHDVSVLLDIDPRIAVDREYEPVVWGRSRAGSLTVLSVGSQEQRVLARSGDNLRVDWGYFHLAIPENQHPVVANSSDAMESFLHSGTLPTADNLDMPKRSEDAADLAVLLAANVTASNSAEMHVLLSYTQGYAIEYMHRRLREFWQRNGQTPEQMLEAAETQYAGLVERGKHFDANLRTALEHAGGKEYSDLAILAYRQTLAAHALVADLDGAPLMFPKENFSNGCISTVDVLYPSAPFFLFMNPALLEAQLKPVLEYAMLPRWKFPFAPHDLGRYPLANGQVYGGGERTEEDQMPVEESGNLLILVAALGRAQGNWHVAQQYWPLFTKWADYLAQKGLDPENQLSTDDFAGHLAHNANLSIKAIEGLGAYALMAQGLGKSNEAARYQALTRKMAREWEVLAKDGDHYNLAFDAPGTWSQKYNLVWDQLLGLSLFDPDVKRSELSFYAKHINEYGLPLDNRKDYTKLDWEIWTATLSETKIQFQLFMAPIAKWMNEGPSRVPLTDWYDTKSGKQMGFQARSVVGGVFIKALADAEVVKEWRGVSQKNSVAAQESGVQP